MKAALEKRSLNKDVLVLKRIKAFLMSLKRKPEIITDKDSLIINISNIVLENFDINAALQFALRIKNFELAGYLWSKIRQEKENSPTKITLDCDNTFAKAFSEGDLFIVKMLVHMGCKLNESSLHKLDYAHTPYNIVQKQVSIVKFLVDTVFKDSHTIISRVLWLNDVDLIIYILSKNVFSKDTIFNAMIKALDIFSYEIFEFFVEKFKNELTIFDLYSLLKKCGDVPSIFELLLNILISRIPAKLLSIKSSKFVLEKESKNPLIGQIKELLFNLMIDYITLNSKDDHTKAIDYLASTIFYSPAERYIFLRRSIKIGDGSSSRSIIKNYSYDVSELVDVIVDVIDERHKVVNFSDFLPYIMELFLESSRIGTEEFQKILLYALEKDHLGYLTIYLIKHYNYKPDFLLKIKEKVIRNSPIDRAIDRAIDRKYRPLK